MLSTLYLLHYNNYYNRILKKQNSIEEYMNFMIGTPIQGVNFIPNDGVTAEQVVPAWEDEIPDYLLVVKNNSIISRWFIVESTRTLAGQFKLSLYRDLLADYQDEIMTAPMFFEKGYVNINDNFIFNDEQVSVNQIKQAERQLKDPTECPWIVGYCALPTGETEPTRIEYGISTDTYDYYSPTLQDWDFYQYVSTNTAKIKFVKSIDFTFKLEKETNKASRLYDLKFNKNGPISFSSQTGLPKGYMNPIGSAQTIYENINTNGNTTLYNSAKSYFGLTDDNDLYYKLLEFSDDSKRRILKVGSGSSVEYYSIELVINEQVQNDYKPQVNDNLYNAWKNWCVSINTVSSSNLIGTDYRTASFVQNVVSDNIYIKLNPITPYSSLEFYFPYGRKALTDSPYCMFAIPYGEIYVKHSEGLFETNGQNGLSIAAGIASSLGSKLYDIQLLPYCPIPLIRNNYNPKRVALDEAPFSSWTKDENYILIENVNQILFFCESSSGSFNINLPNNYYTFSDALIFKTNMLTSSLRLCSPNYNGVFEFNSYKNRGVDFIKVDYNYKPYQPYIHLAPNFKGLYGSDFDDARGLICGGDFSLPITQNAWNEYQIRNKTYQEQFNRQIENMEIQHKYARIQDITNAITGTLGGATSAGMTGAMAGGVLGAGIIGAVGGATSLAGGIADIKINQALRNEAMDYTKDLFGMQIDNIKALPNSLTKVSSFNKNNKIFPFIEVYGCTEDEYNAVFRKIQYNGMSINRIDTLENVLINKPLYMGLGYFKGQLIRLETIVDDSHIVNAIASELYKGVYI